MAAFADDRDFDLIFKSLYEKCNDAVYKNIFKLVKDEQVTEDLFQEVFISLHQSLPTLDPSRSIEGWLFVVSYHKALAHLKAKVKTSITYIENYDDYLSLDSSYEESTTTLEDQSAILSEAVDCLSSRKRQAFTLIRYENKSLDEAASIMGLSRKSVDDYLKQATNDIKSIIKRQSIYTVHSLLLVILSNL
ncbi:MAG: sigma-70 family RNA polymerase sigma factor [Pedobacter sp.]